MLWKNIRPQSVWREFNFAFNQVKRTVEPHLSLNNMITGWNDIAKLLSECPRRRKPQLLKYFQQQQ